MEAPSAGTSFITLEWWHVDWCTCLKACCKSWLWEDHFLESSDYRAGVTPASQVAVHSLAATAVVSLSPGQLCSLISVAFHFVSQTWFFNSSIQSISHLPFSYIPFCLQHSELVLLLTIKNPGGYKQRQFLPLGEGFC